MVRKRTGLAQKNIGRRRRAPFQQTSPRSVKRSLIFKGRVFSVIRETFFVRGRRLMRETIRHPGAVAIVPVLDDGRVVCVRQYRRSVRKELLELPAGTLNRKESALSCARRELEEETGFRAGRMQKLVRFYTAPGFVSEEMTLYMASDLVRTEQLHLDDDEMLSPVALPIKHLLLKINNGQIRDAKTIIGILLAWGSLRESPSGPVDSSLKKYA